MCTLSWILNSMVIVMELNHCQSMMVMFRHYFHHRLYLTQCILVELTYTANFWSRITYLCHCYYCHRRRRRLHHYRYHHLLKLNHRYSDHCRLKPFRWHCCCSVDRPIVVAFEVSLHDAIWPSDCWTFKKKQCKNIAATNTTTNGGVGKPNDTYQTCLKKKEKNKNCMRNCENPCKTVAHSIPSDTQTTVPASVDLMQCIYSRRYSISEWNVSLILISWSLKCVTINWPYESKFSPTPNANPLY